MDLLPADHFSLEQLTVAYNQTRIDYIVPMPMNVARLREYINRYDVDLSASWVAVSGSVILGLGMLGIREGRAWITRVGVLPSGRRQGTGRAIIDSLLASAAERELEQVWLEVIEGNEPARQLFVTSGFEQTRELLVARRPPSPSNAAETGWEEANSVKSVATLDHEAALALLAKRCERPNWLKEIESMRNTPNLTALMVELHDGGRGWVAYHAGLLQLTQIELAVINGQPEQVAFQVLQTLHSRHPSQDAIAENLPATSPIWPGFQQAGYFDVFRRLEMLRSVHE